VWPLAPTFDTIGPMARDVAGLVSGMELLEPGFTVAETTGVTIGRLRPAADPLIDAAVDRVLHHAEWPVLDLVAPGWDRATADAALLLVVEAWESNRALVARDPDGIGTDVRERLMSGATFDAAAVTAAWSGQQAWSAALNDLFDRVDFLVTPTLSLFPPLISEGGHLLAGRCTLPVNLAGAPALALPLRTEGPLPASIQLIGPAHSEERLLAAGAWLESAAAG
jgi:amidase